MADQIIPVTSEPRQRFAVTLSIDNAPLTLQLQLAYSEIAGYWLLSVRNRSGVLLLDSIPLLAGAYPAANLLGQYAYLQIGSVFLLNVSGIADDAPTRSNLGTDWQVLWTDTPTN